MGWGLLGLPSLPNLPRRVERRRVYAVLDREDASGGAAGAEQGGFGFADEQAGGDPRRDLPLEGP